MPLLELELFSGQYNKLEIISSHITNHRKGQITNIIDKSTPETREHGTDYSDNVTEGEIGDIFTLTSQTVDTETTEETTTSETESSTELPSSDKDGDIYLILSSFNLKLIIFSMF